MTQSARHTVGAARVTASITADDGKTCWDKYWPIFVSHLSAQPFLSLSVGGLARKAWQPPTESAQAGTWPHGDPKARPEPVSHTPFSMWTPQQITFPIVNNQTHSSVVTESNYERK